MQPEELACDIAPLLIRIIDGLLCLRLARNFLLVLNGLTFSGELPSSFSPMIQLDGNK